MNKNIYNKKTVSYEKRRLRHLMVTKYTSRTFKVNNFVLSFKCRVL